jgi:hypothetical protein
MTTAGTALAKRVDPAKVTVTSLHPASFIPTKMVLESEGRSIDSLEAGVESTLRRILDRAPDRSARAEDVALAPQSAPNAWSSDCNSGRPQETHERTGSSAGSTPSSSASVRAGSVAVKELTKRGLGDPPARRAPRDRRRLQAAPPKPPLPLVMDLGFGHARRRPGSIDSDLRVHGGGVGGASTIRAPPAVNGLSGACYAPTKPAGDNIRAIPTRPVRPVALRCDVLDRPVEAGGADR